MRGFLASLGMTTKNCNGNGNDAGSGMGNDSGSGYCRADLNGRCEREGGGCGSQVTRGWAVAG